MLREERLPKLAEVEPGIWYVDLGRYSGSEFRRDVYPKLRSARATIFDARAYPAIGIDLLQGLADGPLTSDHFQDVITRYPDRKQVEYVDGTWTAPANRPKFTARAAFLTDARAVSYAETFLSMAANHALGPIVGAATAGSNGAVNLVYLPGGYRVSFTGQRTIRKDGSQFHGIGVRPTAAVSRTLQAVVDGRDEVLEKAIALVRQ
jgi:hypothetical protein